jgi:hypothetical protein
MVIDVIGSLFDQILSDPRCRRRWRARSPGCSLPVLRAALATRPSSRRAGTRCGASSTASPRWPAPSTTSTATAGGKLPVEACATWCRRSSRATSTRSRSTAKLERAGAVHRRAAARGAGASKRRRLPCWRARNGAAHRSSAMRSSAGGELKPMSLPDFLRDFLSRSGARRWYRRRAVDMAGRRWRALQARGRDLVMSVQPKGSPDAAQGFLMQLPTLMKELNEGMDADRLARGRKKAFFGQLLPAHAESLKAADDRARLQHAGEADRGRLQQRPRCLKKGTRCRTDPGLSGRHRP